MCVCVCVCILYIYVYIYNIYIYTHTYIYIAHLLYSSVSRYLVCFHVLAIVNSAAMNTGVHVSFQVTVLSGYMPRSGIAQSYGSSIFSFLRNLHTVLHSGRTNYIPTNSVRGFPFLTPSPALIIYRLFDDGLLTGMR